MTSYRLTSIPIFFLSQDRGAKMFCAIGMKRKSQTPRSSDENVNPWGKKYLYSWGSCGNPYNWFDYMQVEYKVCLT